MLNNINLPLHALLSLDLQVVVSFRSSLTFFRGYDVMINTCLILSSSEFVVIMPAFVQKETNNELFTLTMHFVFYIEHMYYEANIRNVGNFCECTKK